MSVICCGFGHRFLFTNIELELDEVIEKLITENGVDVFYVFSWRKTSFNKHLYFHLACSIK